MTEAEFFEQILGIEEIRVDRVDWQEQALHIYCSSILEEALCPHCLNKRQVVHQTYERQFRDLPITGKEVYLHLSQRQFYCPDCDRHFNERFSFVDPKRTMARRYERYVYECCKASTLQKILCTGQHFQIPPEILEFFGEVEGDVTQEIEAVTEEGLERSPKSFLRGSAGPGHGAVRRCGGSRQRPAPAGPSSWTGERRL